MRSTVPHPYVPCWHRKLVLLHLRHLLLEEDIQPKTTGLYSLNALDLYGAAAGWAALGKDIVLVGVACRGVGKRGKALWGGVLQSVGSKVGLG